MIRWGFGSWGSYGRRTADPRERECSTICIHRCSKNGETPNFIYWGADPVNLFSDWVRHWYFMRHHPHALDRDIYTHRRWSMAIRGDDGRKKPVGRWSSSSVDRSTQQRLFWKDGGSLVGESIPNFASRLIYGGWKYDHVTQLLRDKLHWLRVPQRMQYKCCLTVYKALHGWAPAYIADFCNRVPTTEHRSSLRFTARSSNKLFVPRSTKFSERSFSVAGHSAWNSLPDFVVSAPSIKKFKNGT